jgi:hypothetical protein
VSACRCKHPDRQLDGEVAYCGACGELLPDLQRDVLAAIARAVAGIDRRLQANGSEASVGALLARNLSAPPRVALTKGEAAAALGVSPDSFERHVQPELKLIRRGRLLLVPVAELERWVAEQAAPTLGEG